MDGSIVFTGLHQCALPTNTWFPGPARLSIQNCIGLVQQFLRSSRQISPYTFAMGRHFSASELPHCVGDQNPHLIRVFFDPPKQHFEWFSHFCGAHDCETIIGSIYGAYINCIITTASDGFRQMTTSSVMKLEGCEK